MTQSRNVREGRYNGCIDGKHCRSRRESLRSRVSMAAWLSRAWASRYISYIDPEPFPIQDQLKGEGPYPNPDSIMQAELGQIGTVRFVSKV